MSTAEVKTIEQKIREEVIKELSEEYANNLKAEVVRMKKENDETIQKALADWKKEQEPPTPAQLSEILNQEYVSFMIKIPWNGSTKEFTITELSMRLEKKLYKLVREKIIPRLRDFNLMSLPDGDIETKAQALFDIIDPTMDLLAEVTVLILNPRNEIPELTEDWVKDNLSPFRVWNIITAQMEANRIRDFFSGVSRTFQKGRMIPAASTRN